MTISQMEGSISVGMKLRLSFYSLNYSDVQHLGPAGLRRHRYVRSYIFTFWGQRGGVVPYSIVYQSNSHPSLMQSFCSTIKTIGSSCIGLIALKSASINVMRHIFFVGERGVHLQKR